MKKILSLVLAIALMATVSFSAVYAADWEDSDYDLSMKIGTLSTDDDGNLIATPVADPTKLEAGETYTAWLEIESVSELRLFTAAFTYSEYMEIAEGTTGSGKNRHMKLFNADWYDWATWSVSENAPGCTSGEVEYYMYAGATIPGTEAQQSVLTWNEEGHRMMINIDNGGPIDTGMHVDGPVVAFAFDFTVAADAPAGADLSLNLVQEKYATVVCWNIKEYGVYPKLNSLTASVAAAEAPATPTPTPTATPTPTPTPTATPTVAPTATPTVAPTAAPELINTAATENVLTTAEVAGKAFTAFAKIANIAVTDVAEFGIKFASGDAAVSEDDAKAGEAYVAEGALADGSFSVRLINGEGEVDYFEAAYAGFIPYMVVNGVEYYGAFTTLK